MRSVRIHTVQPLADGAEIRLEPRPARHLVKVLRQREGAAVTLFNGDGREFPGTIIESRPPDRCLLRLDAGIRPAIESPLAITLVQAIGRGERMDWCIQKACELGVDAICPVFTERTEVRLSAARAEKRLRHWRGVAIAACEQSGRCHIPDIAAPQQLTASGFERSPRFFLHPESARTPGRLVAPDPPEMLVAVGPEGGFTEAETAWLTDRDFQPLALGPRILRTETAGPAAIAVMQARFGDWQ